VKALNASPSDNNKYFFWNGTGLPTSAVKIWERSSLQHDRAAAGD
jgi:hypothetical protein